MKKKYRKIIKRILRVVTFIIVFALLLVAWFIPMPAINAVVVLLTALLLTVLSK